MGADLGPTRKNKSSWHSAAVALWKSSYRHRGPLSLATKLNEQGYVVQWPALVKFLAEKGLLDPTPYDMSSSSSGYEEHSL